MFFLRPQDVSPEGAQKSSNQRFLGLKIWAYNKYLSIVYIIMEDLSYKVLTTQGGNRPRFVGKRKYTRSGRYSKKANKGKIAKVVKSVLDKKVEFKHYTLTGQSMVLSQTILQFNLLSGITEGDDVAERTGRQIIVRSIQIMGYFFMGDNTNICRLLLVQELENSATLSTDLWQANSVNALRKNETLGKYRVLWDRRCNLQTYTNTQELYKNFFKCNIKVKYNAVNGSPIKNNVFLVGISDSSAIPHPNYLFDVRVYFNDM